MYTCVIESIYYWYHTLVADHLLWHYAHAKGVYRDHHLSCDII